MYSSNVYHIPILHSSVPLIRRVFLFPILTPTTHVTDYCLPQSAISAQRRSRDIPLLQHLLSSSVHHDGPQAEVTQETNYYS